MSDLDGEDAFRMVLERLTDAEINARRAIEGASAAVQKAHTAEEDRNRALRETAQLEGKEKARMPRLIELWNAANAVLPRLTVGNDDPYRDRLAKALQDAGPDCDQVPF